MFQIYIKKDQIGFTVLVVTYWGNKSVRYHLWLHVAIAKNDLFWHTVKSLKEKTPLGILDYLSIELCSIRKCNKKSIFLWPFLGIFFFVDPRCQMWSTLTACISSRCERDQAKLNQVIASHIDSIYTKIECPVPGTCEDIDHGILKILFTNWIWRHFWHFIQLTV